MQASMRFHIDDLIIITLKNLSQLRNPIVIGSCRNPDIESSTDLNHVASFQRAVMVYEFQRSVSGKNTGYAVDLRSARRCSHGRNNSDFINNHGGVFNKHRIWERGLYR